MKNFLIFTSFLVLAILAAFDTKAIMKELAAVTPSQIEMGRELPSSSGEGINKKFDINKDQPQNSIPTPDRKPINFETPQNTTKQLTPSLNPIEKRD